MKKGVLWSFLFAAVACLSAGALSLRSVSASAETAQAEEVSETTIAWLENNFVMDYGASVRVGTQTTDESGKTVYEGYGIRFSVTATDDAAKAAFANIAASDAITGVIIAPYTTVASVMDANGITDQNELLTAETVFGANGKTSLFDFAAKGQTWTDKTVYNVQSALEAVDTKLYGAIVNLYTTNFLQKYTGVAYVGVPSAYTESGEVSTYDYYFAKYASGEDPITRKTVNDVIHNTRCMYYVAQKAVEENDANAAALQACYIDEFASNEATKATAARSFKYTVVHHYVDENGADTIVTDTGNGAKLAEYGVGAGSRLEAVANPQTIDGKTYVLDDTTTELLNRSYLYVARMTYLHVYYTVESVIADNQTTTNNMLYNTMKNDTATYFGDSMKITGSAEDPVLGSTNSGISAIFGQSTVTFTGTFVNELIDSGFTKVYIETAELYVNQVTSFFEGQNVVVDTIDITGCVTQTLDAKVVGYTVVEKEETLIFNKYKTATITFTGITITLPNEKVAEDENITLTAKVGDSEISGTWTLTGLLFG